VKHIPQSQQKYVETVLRRRNNERGMATALPIPFRLTPFEKIQKIRLDEVETHKRQRKRNEQNPTNQC